MLCKATTGSIAVLVFCFAPLALTDIGGRGGDRGALLERPVSTMSKGPIRVVNDSAGRLAVDETEAFAASPLALRARFGRGGGAGTTKRRWIKLTAPRGEPVYVNLEQIISFRSDTEISGASTQLEFASGKFQRVREEVERVIQLISAISDAQEIEETASAASSATRQSP
jgi:hypothetical protein